MAACDKILEMCKGLTTDKVCARYHNDPLAFAVYAAEIGLVHETRTKDCEECYGSTMNTVPFPRATDGYRLECPSCHAFKSLRIDSVCSGSPLSLLMWVLVGICYDADLTMAQTGRILSLGENSVERLYGCFDTEVLECLAREEPLMLGGPGEVVEIDEMYYKVDRKYKRGALRPRHFMGEWIFGMVHRGTGYHYDVVVYDRDAETLGPIIREHVLPGTILCTDEWKGYDELCEYYDHRKCCHSTGLYAYVDLTDGVKAHQHKGGILGQPQGGIAHPPRDPRRPYCAGKVRKDSRMAPAP
jgi:hypothetical protein